jgi:hypothetical protein
MQPRTESSWPDATTAARIGYHKSMMRRELRRFPINAPARVRLTAAAAVIGVFLLSGCKSDPHADRQMQMRVQGISDTVEIWGYVLSKRPGRLDRSLAFIPDNLDHHAVRLKENAAGGWRDFGRNAERFEARQPVYLQETAERLWGAPERAGYIAPILFF